MHRFNPAALQHAEHAFTDSGIHYLGALCADPSVPMCAALLWKLRWRYTFTDAVTNRAPGRTDTSRMLSTNSATATTPFHRPSKADTHHTRAFVEVSIHMGMHTSAHFWGLSVPKLNAGGQSTELSTWSRRRLKQEVWALSFPQMEQEVNAGGLGNEFPKNGAGGESRRS
eukprot:scaffold279290_cov26-Tisochrysis_lutea.AAC.1